MTTIHDILECLEEIAPLSYQESYDNAGLLTGNSTEKVEGILISLDMTEAIVDEAIERKCNLIIAHHPIIFKGLKKLTGSNYVERTIIKAIKNNIALYAIHTNLDSISTGVNKKICDKLELINTNILAPKEHTFKKLVTFIPQPETEKVMQALFAAGAGKVGNYKECSFQSSGNGTFYPLDQAQPNIGQIGQRENVLENRVEVIFEAPLQNKIVSALLKNHPYEEPAYDVLQLENRNKLVGSGMIGELKAPMDELEYLHLIKKQLNLKVLKHTTLTNKPIKKVAVCGGSGSFLIKNAIAAKADIFITGDVKYHEFFDAENKIIIADVGHYESEVFTKDLIYEKIIDNFSNIAIQLAQSITNPVSFL